VLTRTRDDTCGFAPRIGNAAFGLRRLLGHLTLEESELTAKLGDLTAQRRESSLEVHVAVDRTPYGFRDWMLHERAKVLEVCELALGLTHLFLKRFEGIAGPGGLARVYLLLHRPLP
jgi:hypothetical protein